MAVNLSLERIINKVIIEDPMDIYFILIGNLLMDSAIAIFAILSMFVARYSDAYRRGYELETKCKEAINNLKEAKNNTTNSNHAFNLMSDTMLKCNTELFEYLQKYNEIFSKKSLILNPLEGKKLMILSTAFIDGIIFQIIGLFIL